METVIRVCGILFCSTLFSSAVQAAPHDTLVKDEITVSRFRGATAYDRLENAVQQLYKIKERGGWPIIKATQKYYLKDQSAPAISQIKERLRISGDYKRDDDSPLFTQDLVRGVQRAQKRFGFTPNGVVDALLIKELNVPFEERIQQLLVNMERVRDLPMSEGTRLVANIPEYKLHVYEDNHEVFSMKIVVGAEDHQTTRFNDEMTHVVFSPYWNVPESIVQNEILPAMNRNRNYLSSHGYEITGHENGLPVIRQKPGPNNSLGRVKFIFPNEHGIYFHDTPGKGLFQYPKRTFSHGCIRLSNPAKLARYLLRNDPEWNAEKIKNAMHSGKEQWVKLSSPVAVSLAYLTAWVDDEGLLQLRRDVYGLDKKEAYKVASR